MASAGARTAAGTQPRPDARPAPWAIAWMQDGAARGARYDPPLPVAPDPGVSLACNILSPLPARPPPVSLLPLLPWLLAAASLALLLVVAVAWWLRRGTPRSRPLPTEWTLSPRPVFNSDERRIYRQLREALPHHVVLSKLPLVRFTQPTDPQEVRYWFDLLGGIHVSFAVCSANGRVLAVIDLDNDRINSRRVLQIKQSVLAACRIRYLRCPADHLPSIPELQLLVPQNNATARAPQPAPAGLNGAGPRRRDRPTLWQDSGFMQDSFFGPEGQADFGPGSFGTLRSGLSAGFALQDTRPSGDDGGVVVETPAPGGSSLRH